MENTISFDLACEYLNYLVWEHMYEFKTSNKITFQEISSTYFENNIDEAIKNFFVCEFNNTSYDFQKWVETKEYQLDETIINESKIIMGELIFNSEENDDFKELVGLSEIYIK